MGPLGDDVGKLISSLSPADRIYLFPLQEALLTLIVDKSRSSGQVRLEENAHLFTGAGVQDKGRATVLDGDLQVAETSTQSQEAFLIVNFR